MATNRWIVYVPTGEFQSGGAFEPINLPGSVDAQGQFMPDPNYAVVTLSGESMPDPRKQRWDGSAVVAKSAAEVSAYDAAALSTRNLATSRQKDVLANCALIVRAKGLAAWNAMTPQQKVAATFAEADAWRNLREFLEDKTG